MSSREPPNKAHVGDTAPLDLIANGAVLVAAGLVAWSESLWPDVIVGIAIAILFLRTATLVLRESLAEISLARGGVIEGAG